MQSKHSTRVGLAGWSYQDWAGVVYPKHKSRGFHETTYLAQYFDTIEINSSFYHPLQLDHCLQWLDQIAANPRFLFTAKLWQRFTHERGGSVVDEHAVRVGFDVLFEAERLGAVLLQFPFSFHNTKDNFAYLKKLLKRFAEYPLVVEVRHASWNNDLFYEALRERKVGFCNIDQPIIGESLTPSERSTAGIGYVRLHGRRYDTWFSDDPAKPSQERYNYLYSEAELAPWAFRVNKVAENSNSTFVITNNHYQGKGVVNALQLLYLLTRAKVKVPEALRQHYPELEEIASEPPQEPMLFSK